MKALIPLAIVASLAGCGSEGPSSQEARDAMLKRLVAVNGPSAYEQFGAQMKTLEVERCEKTDAGNARCQLTDSKSNEKREFVFRKDDGKGGWIVLE